MTQQTLAAEARVSQSTISQLEKGIRRPSVPTLTRIARVLGCKLDDLVNEE